MDNTGIQPPSKTNKITVSLSRLLQRNLPNVVVDSIWDIRYVIEDLRLNECELDNEKFDASLFTAKSIYDNPHDSDESSYRRLLFFKKEFICVYGFSGDRGYSFVEFISQEKADELTEYLLTLRQKTNVSVIDGDDLQLSDNYTVLFERDGELFQHIISPKWSYGTKDRKNMYYLHDDDSITPAEFISFKTNERWCDKEEDKRMIIKLSTGEVIESPYEHIIYKISD